MRGFVWPVAVCSKCINITLYTMFFNWTINHYLVKLILSKTIVNIAWYISLSQEWNALQHIRIRIKITCHIITQWCEKYRSCLINKYAIMVRDTILPPSYTLENVVSITYLQWFYLANYSERKGIESNHYHLIHHITPTGNEHFMLFSVSLLPSKSGSGEISLRTLL